MKTTKDDMKLIKQMIQFLKSVTDMTPEEIVELSTGAEPKKIEEKKVKKKTKKKTKKATQKKKRVKKEKASQE
jgi:hypothetical protein